MKNEFVKLYKKHIKRRGADKLLGYLVDKGFLEAPASTKYHGSYEGGLVEHSVNVMNRLMKKEVLQGYTKETIAIVGLLHDVCKVDLYKPQLEKEKIAYEYNTKSFPVTSIRLRKNRQKERMYTTRNLSQQGMGKINLYHPAVYELDG